MDKIPEMLINGRFRDYFMLSGSILVLFCAFVCLNGDFSTVTINLVYYHGIMPAADVTYCTSGYLVFFGKGGVRTPFFMFVDNFIFLCRRKFAFSSRFSV